MGHDINALIGSPVALAELTDRFGAPAPTALPFGLIVLPLDHDRLDALALSSESVFEGFIHLKPSHARAIEKTATGKALYIETSYFGGIGQQAAAFFEKGQLTWQGTASTDNERKGKTPISEGLAMLGVTASEGDEFDAVGLSAFRNLESLGILYDD